MTELKKRVLVIEDEESVARFLISSLEANQYLTRWETSGNAGAQAAIEFRPQIVILDLGLPDMDGHAVLLKLREWLKAPILILTAREGDDDKVRALDQGADDYLTKPFSVAELLARIRVGLRHSESGVTGLHYRKRGIDCDVAGHTVKVDGNLVHLTATEYDILKVLIKSAGKVVTHRALLKEIWGPNSVEHTQYLRVYVGQLRKKLKSKIHPEELIQTEPGVGYRLAEE
ncbi:MAG: response regulator transcription factor [Cryobacterium sp.]|nr:response regulator transcription factor [Oligoflexia bacterium]